MGGLPAAKFAIVRTLVEQAPDKVVGGLQRALASAGRDSSLGDVRRLVEDEVADRRLRNTVFSPIVPLFGDPLDPSGRLILPRCALQPLWRAVKAAAPAQVAAAARHIEDFIPEESSPAPFDQVIERLAKGLANQEADFAGAMKTLESAQAGGVEVLLSCLALSPVVRASALRLPEWISHTGAERAAARIAYADAVAISPDGGPRFFEMLSAQLPESWRILRIVSSVMDRPSEAYLSASEFAVFALRLMDAMDEALQRISQFDPAGGAVVGQEVGRCVEQMTLQLAEVEQSVELLPEGPWGARVRKQRAALAAVVERRLREIERAMSAALPEHQVRVARAMKSQPRMTSDADPVAVDSAFCLLTFAQEIRTSASYGGFSSARAKAVEKAGEVLDGYVENVLDMIKHEEIEDRDRARAFLDLAGRCAALIYEPRAQTIIERRASAAFALRKPVAPDERSEVETL